MTNNMTDDELRQAISEKREPKPENYPTHTLTMSECENWQFTIHIIEQDKSGATFEAIWTPINWLSWENAGRLLEELPYANLLRQVDGWTCWGKNGLDFHNAETATRAICEAWLEANKK